MWSIPEKLKKTLGGRAEGAAWLDGLGALVSDFSQRWTLVLDPPFQDEASCSWVAACRCDDGSPAVLKIGFPHMEAEHEIDGLAFWQGDPAVRLLKADRQRQAMLLERCEPGRVLRGLPEPEQDEIIAGLLKRLWRRPHARSPFRPLAEMIRHWCEESVEQADRWADAGIAQEGLQVYEELLDARIDPVVLAADLHAGNVLSARRQPWLVIDPKPFVGDPCYDATQHLLNCEERLTAKPLETIARFADLLDVDFDRVRRWMFARLAVDINGRMEENQALARRLTS